MVARSEADRDGYVAVQLGAGTAKAKNVAKPQRGHFGKAEVEPKAKVAEFRVAEDALLDVGAEISADHYVAGQMVDIQGVPRARALPGGMKRWGFGGLRATHGVSVSHRSLGSTGQRQDPGKVFKNKKMAGHMGDKQPHPAESRNRPHRRRARPLFVKGSVPGHKGGWLLVKTRSRSRVPTARRTRRHPRRRSAPSMRKPRPAWSRLPPSTNCRPCRAPKEVAAGAAENTPCAETPTPRDVRCRGKRPTPRGQEG